MKDSSNVRKIAFVGDHLPRRCGIATFTSDLLAAVAAAHPQSQCFSVSVNDIKDGYEYPEVVRFEIEEQDLSSYLRAADFLNISNVDIVCLQHEFGIYGGPAGGHILAFLRELRMPVVITLHTILREPKGEQRRVMQELVALSTRLVVMAKRGRQMLQEIYHAPAAKIDLIPHGIPDVGFVDPTYFKDQFGVEGKVVLLTFGLLSPNKGIAYVLNALPQILAEFPDVVYIVLGATHPNELRENGEGSGDAEEDQQHLLHVGPSDRPNAARNDIGHDDSCHQDYGKALAPTEDDGENHRRSIERQPDSQSSLN